MRDQVQTVIGEIPLGADSVPFGGARAAEDVLLRPDQPLLYRVPEVMKMLAMSRSVAFEQLRNGRLRSVQQGRSRRIPAVAILDYIKLLEREAAQ